METFFQWLDILARLRLIESYYSFDPTQYNRLFDDELAKVGAVSAPEHQEALERLRGFNWVGYIAKSLRNADYHDQREIQERTHDIVVKLLIGTLFRGFDERASGPMDRRFKRAVANAVKNVTERERNRRRLLPSISIGHEFTPGGITADELPGRQAPARGEDIVDDFRSFVRARLGQLGLAILDARLSGEETKSLENRADLGSPSRYVIKRVVQEVKGLGKEYAERLGDPAFLRQIERAVEREGATVQKRLSTTTARQIR